MNYCQVWIVSRTYKIMSVSKSTSHLFASNAVFVEELYGRYCKDPESVSQEWQDYFAELADDPDDVSKAVAGAPWKPFGKRVIGVKDPVADTGICEVDAHDVQNALSVANLINAYRTYGHWGAKLDPLDLTEKKDLPSLDYKTYGFDDGDLGEEVVVPDAFFCEGKMLFEDLLASLKGIYSSKIGSEFMHIESAEERNWIMQNLEANLGKLNVDTQEKKKALQDIMEAGMFEEFLHTKFTGAKRFSVEGGESSIAALDVIVQNSVSHGVEEFVIGMAHRGRLNTLTKIMGKPYHAMFSEFKGEMAFPEDMDIPGDVKYHLGASLDREIAGKKIHLSLTPNPSHLEVVNAVVLGRVRAKQDQRQDKKRERVMGILVHGDAAFAGQGSVMEALSLSQLKAYHTGGTIHVVANNQIGFTTNPSDSRSTLYCTDIAKFISAPIFHVNGDDPEAVVYISKLASEYRAKFKKDVVIDIVCYRKYGHNEGDEPMFTQPIMYKKIKSKPSPYEVYSQKLAQEGVFSEQEFQSSKTAFKSLLEKEFEASQKYKPKEADWLGGSWSDFQQAFRDRAEEGTGVAIKKLMELGNKISQYPGNFKINAKVQRLMEARRQMAETGKDLDWGMGEALAFATLLDEGYPVRISGQDVKRGTFTHRHAALYDQETQEEYISLNHLQPEQKIKFEAHNSNLSEFAVLAFEYGYSVTDPKTLTIWEAQFGDFANTAQVIVDQYISSSEPKWLRMNGLVMLLPHGYEGQGPEHSSARPERFLQLCARDNMQVVNCTTPASIFHVLRRQVHRNFRKPLVVMSPKSLLRHKLAISSFDEMKEGTTFRPVLPEAHELVADNKVKRVIMCSGKVYYNLLERREELKRNEVAILRLEQLYPFPNVDLGRELKKYPNADLVWCQEEHENMGYFYFVEPRIEKLLAAIKHKSRRAKYVGRNRAASPAVGYAKLHEIELEKFLKEAFE